jgi:hypothetical protein
VILSLLVHKDPSFIPLEDWTKLCSMCPSEHLIEAGSWVQLRQSKTYKNDLARVLSILGDRLQVAVVPQLPLDPIDVDPYDKEMQDHHLAKWKAKLEHLHPALFDILKVSQLYGGQSVKRMHDGGYKFKQKVFNECSLLLLTVNYSSVDQASPAPVKSMTEGWVGLGCIPSD